MGYNNIIRPWNPIQVPFLLLSIPFEKGQKNDILFLVSINWPYVENDMRKTITDLTSLNDISERAQFGRPA
jgi:hypothetical protein